MVSRTWSGKALAWAPCLRKTCTGFLLAMLLLMRSLKTKSMYAILESVSPVLHFAPDTWNSLPKWAHACFHGLCRTLSWVQPPKGWSALSVCALLSLK
jgi:hypothetical protein